MQSEEIIECLRWIMKYKRDGDEIEPIELIDYAMCIGRAGEFDAKLKKLDASFLRFLIDYLSGVGSWNEGVLLCEAEIARRGLHIDDVGKRFEL